MAHFALAAKLRNFSVSVDFSIDGSTVTAIVGPSGSGKTTILQMIAGFFPDSNGRIEVGGEIWQESLNKVFLDPFRRPVGYVFQKPFLYPHLSIVDNLKFGSRWTPKVRRRLTIEEVISLFGLEDVISAKPDQLSGGERQKVCLARSFLSAPSLWLLDEPLSSVDFLSKKKFIRLLKDVFQQYQVPVIYVTHSMEEMAQIADRVIYLKGGKIVKMGDVSELNRYLATAHWGSGQLSVLITGVLVEIDRDYLLAQVAISGMRLWVKWEGQRLGEQLRLRVDAKDVSVSLERPICNSIDNIVVGNIDRVQDRNATENLMTLSCSQSLLLCQISKKSYKKLDLYIGKKVFVQIHTIITLS